MIALLTFADWRAATPSLPGPVHGELFRFLPETDQSACWEELLDCVRLVDESELLYEQRLREEWPPPKRHQRRQRSTAATSTRPGTVALSRDDPLKQIDPRGYVEALTGEVVPASGWLRCPLPDHEDRTPSFQVKSSHWKCWGCGRWGDSIDLASALYGIPPTGRDYFRLRDLILERLLWAPIHPKEDR